MRGRIGTKGQMVLLGLVPQSVQNDARLNASNSPLRVELENLVHVLGEVQHHGDIAALPAPGSCRLRAAAPERRISCTRPRPRARRRHRAERPGRWESGGNSRRRSRTCARLPRSKRTSPFTARFNSFSSSVACEKRVYGLAMRAQRQTEWKCAPVFTGPIDYKVELERTNRTAAGPFKLGNGRNWTVAGP